jgi:hypothetical protein
MTTRSEKTNQQKGIKRWFLSVGLVTKSNTTLAEKARGFCV